MDVILLDIVKFLFICKLLAFMVKVDKNVYVWMASKPAAAILSSLSSQ